MSLDELYQELLLDHFKHPRCRGALKNPDATALVRNPLCGDEVELSLRLKDSVLDGIAFGGHGCSISQASASLMAELLKGKKMDFARDASAAFKALMRGEKPVNEAHLGDALALAGVRKFSARIKCALLAWEALDRCLATASTKK